MESSNDNGTPRTVVVVGAGISGLTVAFELMQRAERLDSGLRIRCLESSDRAGGNIRSGRLESFLCEWGPTGFLDNAPATLTLARRLGLGERLLPAGPSAADRFIYRAGKLRRVPTTPLSFLASSILPLGGKLRLLCEPLAGSRKGAGTETIHDFTSRRIGRQAASLLVDAMVSGIYAGDVRQLELEATFPKMRRMESEHGSLFRAMLALRKRGSGGGPAGPGGRLTSFRNGLQELTDALASALGERLLLNSPVESISDLGVRGLRVHLAEGAPLDADAVVLACPSWKASPMVRLMDPGLAEAMAGIPSAALAVAHLGYRSDAIGRPYEGFGFLVPRSQGPRILGGLWISSIFEGRAPEGRFLTTIMIGGAHDPGAVELGDDELIKIVLEDLAATMGIEARPFFVKLIRHPRGIPQYTLGHTERLERIASLLERHSGLWVSGNSYLGISVNACIEEAPGIAEKVLGFLGS
jgi:oxygen-dependent protoporphyrinogen oxidase